MSELHPSRAGGTDTLVRVWISSDDVQAVAEKGFKLIHAASDFFYLVSVLSLLSIIMLTDHM